MTEPIHYIDINPAFRLTLNQVRIIRLHHVLAVLRIRIRHISLKFTLFVLCFHHPRRLREELPVVWLHQHLGLLTRNMVRNRNLARHNRPPVILFGRIGIGNNSCPSRASLTHRRIATNAHGAGVDDTLGNLSGFVDPDASEFQRQQLLYVLWPIKGQEDNLKVEVALLNVMGVGDRPSKLAPVILWKPIQPSLDRGCS